MRIPSSLIGGLAVPGFDVTTMKLKQDVMIQYAGVCREEYPDIEKNHKQRNSSYCSKSMQI